MEDGYFFSCRFMVHMQQNKYNSFNRPAQNLKNKTGEEKKTF